MRMIWWLGGGALVAAGGLFWGIRQPESAVGRSLTWCCSTQNSGCCGCCTDEIPTLDEIPSDPTPAEETTPTQIAGVGLETDIQVSSSTPILIYEEDGVACGLSEAVELAIFKGPLASADAASPLAMPYCDDDAIPQMAFITDQDESEEAVLDEVEPRNTEEEQSAPSTPMPTDNNELPRCEVTPDYYHQYSGCPHQGQCTRGCTGSGTHCPIPLYREPVAPSVDPEKEPAQPVKGGEEISEPTTPVKLKKKGKPKHETRKPCETYKDELPPGVDLDTMEYRRSDGRLDEYSPGPV